MTFVGAGRLSYLMEVNAVGKDCWNEFTETGKMGNNTEPSS